MKFLNLCLVTVTFAVASIVVVDAQRDSELFIVCVYGPSPNNSKECKVADQIMMPVFNDCVDEAYGLMSETVTSTNFENALISVGEGQVRHLRAPAVEPEEAEVEPEGTDFSMVADFSMVTGEHRNLGGGHACDILLTGRPTAGQIASCCLIPGTWQNSSYCGGGGGRRRLGAELVAAQYLEPLLNVVDNTCTTRFRDLAKELNAAGNQKCFPDPDQGVCKGFYITV